MPHSLVSTKVLGTLVKTTGVIPNGTWSVDLSQHQTLSFVGADEASRKAHLVGHLGALSGSFAPFEQVLDLYYEKDAQKSLPDKEKPESATTEGEAPSTTQPPQAQQKSVHTSSAAQTSIEKPKEAKLSNLRFDS